MFSFEAQQAITDSISRLTFNDHLRAGRPLIPERAATIAEEINRGRDGFVHWKRARFKLPQYKEHAVTTAGGFRICMDAIQEFLLLVPFHYVAWTANP